MLAKHGGGGDNGMGIYTLSLSTGVGFFDKMLKREAYITN